MDTAEIFVLIVGLGLIALVLWFFFGGHEEVPSVSTEGKPIYECPMHPWITSLNPTDNCSICGMKLVKRGDAGAGSTVLDHGH